MNTKLTPITPSTEDDRVTPVTTCDQFLVSITGIKINISGRALLILAVGVAAALGCVVVIKLPLF